jgi:hypothetical protein
VEGKRYSVCIRLKCGFRLRDFVTQVHRGELDLKASATESARGHMIAFAAERSRVTGQTVDLDEFIEKVTDAK